MKKGTLKLSKEDTASKYCPAKTKEKVWELYWYGYFLSSMILIAISSDGKEEKWGLSPQNMFGATPFHSKEYSFFDLKRALKKGTFVLLLKRAGVQTPRSPPLVTRLQVFVKNQSVCAYRCLLLMIFPRHHPKYEPVVPTFFSVQPTQASKDRIFFPTSITMNCCMI